MNKKIVQNSVICSMCKDEIWSASVHDFKTCKCGNISVDGGMEYLRRVGNISSYKDTSFYMTEKCIEDITKAVKWGLETSRNEYGIALAVFRALRENGLIKEDNA